MSDMYVNSNAEVIQEMVRRSKIEQGDHMFSLQLNRRLRKVFYGDVVYGDRRSWDVPEDIDLS